MKEAAVGLRQSLRQALYQILELYVALEESGLDVLSEAKQGFDRLNASFVTGLQTSNLSKLLHFDTPQDAGPESLTISLNEHGHLVLELSQPVDWIAIQSFLTFEGPAPYTILIDSVFSSEESGLSLPVIYFMRAFGGPGNPGVRDTPPQRIEAMTGKETLTRYKHASDLGDMSLNERVCLITYFGQPPRRIVLERMRIFALPSQ